MQCCDCKKKTNKQTNKQTKKTNNLRGIMMWSSKNLLELVSLIMLDGVLIKESI